MLLYRQAKIFRLIIIFKWFEYKKVEKSVQLKFFSSLSVLFFVSTPVLAAPDKLPWMTYLFLVMIIALVIAVIVSWRNPKTESFMGRFLLAGVYFWVLTFAQLIILALIYWIHNKL